MEQITIDTRGMACPLPVLRVRKTMRGVAAGAEVLILATDPGAEDDMRAYCATSGSRFLSSATSEDGILRILIQKC
jgi:tRNA 2-thiouridine synthesizing protein A